jgi:hypothetical protein
VGRVIRALKHGFNAFAYEDEHKLGPEYYGGMSGSPRQTRTNYRFLNDKSLIGSIYNRMALDLSSVEFFHCKLDENDVAVEIIRDGLHDRISLDANIDQSAQAFKIDAAMTMFEIGHCALVPIDTTLDPNTSTSYDIQSMRVGRVVNWRARRVTVEVYDDRETDGKGNPINGGIVKQLTMPKDQVCIIENPFYTVMNEPSGTLQRLLRKLSLLDGMDEAAGAGKLDLIFQLPYTVRSETRKKQAEERRADLRSQMREDELGIGYIDVSEKVIQLNRPIDNKLLTQIEFLTAQLYTNLSLTPEILNNTASKEVIDRYYDRTIEPIAEAMRLEMKRKFLTKTARTQRHSIEIYRDPLKLIPVSELPEVADKLIRNAVVTANEFRPKIGFRPSKDPNANKLQNPNMPIDDQLAGAPKALPASEKLKATPLRKKEVENPNDRGLRRIV